MYDSILQKFKACLTTQQIDLTYVDIIEHTLLTLAGIEFEPDSLDCQFCCLNEGKNIYFKFKGLKDADLKALQRFLLKIDPQTYHIKKDNAYFVLTCEAVELKLVDKICDNINELEPDEVNLYQKLSIIGSQKAEILKLNAEVIGYNRKLQTLNEINKALDLLNQKNIDPDIKTKISANLIALQNYLLGNNSDINPYHVARDLSNDAIVNRSTLESEIVTLIFSLTTHYIREHILVSRPSVSWLEHAYNKFLEEKPKQHSSVFGWFFAKNEAKATVVAENRMEI